MSRTDGRYRYISGMYSRKTTGEPLEDDYLRQLDAKLAAPVKEKKEGKQTVLPPTICFARKIGVGAVEVAEILAEKIRYSVADKQLLEYIASTARLSKMTVAAFDERYVGKVQDFFNTYHGGKRLTLNDYARCLFESTVAIAGISPTIFIGRGTHLILPRNRVFAVRLLCTDTFRIDRVAQIMNVSIDRAKIELDRADKEQRLFFKNIYGKTDARAYEFDLVINCDFIQPHQAIAEIVECAFKRRFGLEGV